MSGADDLRTDGRDCPIDCKCPTRYVKWADGSEHDDGRICQLHTFIAEAATDPARRLAILDAMGLDVREGTLIDFKPVPYDPDPGWVVEPPGDIHEREGHHAGVSVFVVRPRGEATDA